MSKSTKIAALGLAAGIALLPVAGAFAVDRTENTETVIVTLPVTCTFNSDGTKTGTNMEDKNYQVVTVVNGQLYNTESGATAWHNTYNVYCNNSAGWSVYAVGSTATSANDNDPYAAAVNQMAPSNHANTPISSAATPVTSGDTADWAFKVTAPESGQGEAANKATITTGYDAYHQIPSTYTKVATAASQTVATGEGRFTTGYQVYIGTATQADTYTGKVTYKLVNPASATPGA